MTTERSRYRGKNPEMTNFFAIASGFFGERGGNRTHDPLIKSQMLYLLSYALAVSAQVPTAWERAGQANERFRG